MCVNVNIYIYIYIYIYVPQENVYIIYVKQIKEITPNKMERPFNTLFNTEKPQYHIRYYHLALVETL